MTDEQQWADRPDTDRQTEVDDHQGIDSSPVEAELLPPVDASLAGEEAGQQPAALHPLRFGLRAVLGAMVLCSVQFALMNYLGMLWGIFFGTVVCLAVIAALLIAAIIMRPRQNSRAMDYLDQWAIRLTVGIVLLMVSFVMAGGGSFAYHQVVRLRMESALQSDLGFSGRSHTVFDGQQHYWCVVVDTIAPGGPFDQAGFRTGDVIKSELAPLEFYQMLEENRGRQINLTAVAAGGSQMIQGLPERQLTVQVPK